MSDPKAQNWSRSLLGNDVDPQAQIWSRSLLDFDVRSQVTESITKSSWKSVQRHRIDSEVFLEMMSIPRHWIDSEVFLEMMSIPRHCIDRELFLDLISDSKSDSKTNHEIFLWSTDPLLRIDHIKSAIDLQVFLKMYGSLFCFSCVDPSV